MLAFSSLKKSKNRDNVILGVSYKLKQINTSPLRNTPEWVFACMFLDIFDLLSARLGFICFLTGYFLEGYFLFLTIISIIARIRNNAVIAPIVVNIGIKLAKMSLATPTITTIRVAIKPIIKMVINTLLKAKSVLVSGFPLTSE